MTSTSLAIPDLFIDLQKAGLVTKNSLVLDDVEISSEQAGTLLRYFASVSDGSIPYLEIPPPTPKSWKLFWAKVDRKTITECWLWMAALDKSGYGKLGINGETHRAPRVAYTWTKGFILPGAHIDHLCRTPACVNPNHLEMVTPTENKRRGNSPMQDQRKQTHCIHGHELIGENVYLWRGHRHCQTCRRRISKEDWQRRKAAR